MPGEELGQTGLRYLGDAGKDVGEPGLGIDAVELRGADEGVHHRRPLAAGIGAAEQPRLASECNAAKGALGGVNQASVLERIAARRRNCDSPFPEYRSDGVKFTDLPGASRWSSIDK